MYRRVRKAPSGPGPDSLLSVIATSSKSLLTEPRATLADLGFHIEGRNDIDAVVDEQGVVFKPYARLTVGMSEEKQSLLSIHWEEIVCATARVIQQVLTSSLPPPWLQTPVIADVESTKHWSEQLNEAGSPRGYGLTNVRLPRAAAEGDEHCELLVSPNWDKASRLIVLVSDGTCPYAITRMIGSLPKHTHRLAIWNRNLTLQGPISKGSLIDAVHQVLQIFAYRDLKCNELQSWESIDMAIIIANPGERYWTAATASRPGRAVTSAYAQFRLNFQSIRDLHSIEAHLSLLFQDYILPSEAGKIHLLSTSSSASALVSILHAHYAALQDRVCSIGLLQPQHALNQLAEPPGFAEWFRQRTLAIAMHHEDPTRVDDHQELIAMAERQAAEAGADDEPLPEVSKGCLVLASSATNIDLLTLNGVKRLVQFFKFRDDGGDLTPLLASYGELEEAVRYAEELKAAMAVNGLHGW